MCSVYCRVKIDIPVWGIVLSPRFCMTKLPWRNTFTMSPMWIWPTWETKENVNTNYLSKTKSNLLHLLSLFISIGTRISLTDKQIVVVLGSQEGVIVEDLWECTYIELKVCVLLSWSPLQPSSSWDNSHARSPRSFPPWSCTVKKPNWTSRGTITYIFGSFSLGISVLIQISNGRTCSKVMLLTRSPTKMKSPEVLACRAMMLLKWLHSSLSSFS